MSAGSGFGETCWAVLQSGSQQQSTSHLLDVRSHEHTPDAAAAELVAGLVAVLGT